MGGLYTKKQYEKHLQAIDAASSCISAAIAQTKEYGERLIPYHDDLIEIAEFFWARCPITRKKLEKPGPDVKDVARVFLTLVRSKNMPEIVAMLDWPKMGAPQRMEAMMERCRRKLKGKLLGTRLILMDADKKPKCEDVDNHKQRCCCKALTLVRLAQAQEEMQ
jgi:hypothetical protein